MQAEAKPLLFLLLVNDSLDHQHIEMTYQVRAVNAGGGETILTILF